MAENTKRWIWTGVVMAVLVAVLIGIAYRYGPTCQLGEEHCSGAVLRQCVGREWRDPGRRWVEIACPGGCVEAYGGVFCRR